MKNIILLGASGSIGTQCIDVVEKNKDKFNIVGLSVGNNLSFLQQYLSNNTAKYCCVLCKDDATKLESEYKNVKFFYGEQGLAQLVKAEKVDLVVNGLQGFVGLRPTLAALEMSEDVALANKEIIVAAGKIVMKTAKENNCHIIPVDSEHSAIFQCLQGYQNKEINKLIITASGGAFLNFDRNQLENVSIQQALNHPRWKMGKKITIDSATMMNKGFEVIEAHHLFNVDYDNINVLMHPQSIIHSMVEFKDKAILAQLGNPDMRIPIQFAMSYPDRLENNFESLDLIKAAKLDFKDISFDRYPLLELAYKIGKLEGNYTAFLNGADQAAVEGFLNQKIKFTEIENLIFKLIDEVKTKYLVNPTLDEIVSANDYGYQRVKEMIQENNTRG